MYWLNYSVVCTPKKSSTSVGGVKVSMVAFQAVDPGSIPGRRKYFLLVSVLYATYMYLQGLCNFLNVKENHEFNYALVIDLCSKSYVCFIYFKL